MKFRSALLAAAAVMAAPLAAKAQPIPGLYIGAGMGGNIMSDEQIKSIGIPPTPRIPAGFVLPLTATTAGRNVSPNAGFAGQVSVGWSFGPVTSLGGPRVELEGLYLNNGISKSSATNVLNTLVNVGGTEQKYGVFANVLWDFDLGTPFVYPYIGGGVGGLWSNWKNVRTYGYNVATGIGGDPSINVNDTVGSFAYQGIVGAAFPIPAVPGLAITTDFRFEGLAGHRNYAGKFTSYTLGLNGAGTTVSTSQNYNYTFMLGVKYAFNAAPPPPPPAPAPAPAVQPARSYLVFFDWDRYNLTDRARQIIREAAENSTRVQYTRIQVNGYTDTSGTPAYNQRLSVRRAQAVAAELVKDGVPRNAISIQGFGETHLLVPTGPNVREPQNRRVEIIIQ